MRDLNLGAALQQMTDIIRRYHILLPTPLALMLKTLVMLEGTSRLLNPNFNLAELIEPYQVQVIKHRFSLTRILRKLYRAYRDWDRLIDILPRDVAEILRRVRNGTFELRHDHHRLESTVNRLVLGILAGSFFLGSSLLFSAKAEPEFGGVSISGLVGFLFSLFFSWRLIRTINQAEDSDRK